MTFSKTLVWFGGFLTMFALVSGQSRPVYSDCADCGICQERYRPICGTDGITYYNPCFLGCQKQCRTKGLRPAYEGECHPPPNQV